MIRWSLALAAALVLVPVALGSSPGRNGRIVFVAERVNGASGLVSVGVDGRHRRVLTHGNDSDPVASPDGRKVAFTRISPSGSASGVYVMNADGRGQRKVADGSYPSWSPDGQRIAYLGVDSTHPPASSDVSVVDLTTGSTTVLWPGVDFLPVWSPDGSHIAGVDAISDGLVVMRADGTDRRMIVPISGAFSWSPDGKRIAYATYDGRLRVATVDGATKDTIVGKQDSIGNVLWSPDGRSIAFTAAQPQGGRAAEVLSLANGSAHTVAKPQDEPLAWSPDSKSLALFRAPADTAQQIVVASADGRSVRQITHEDPTSGIANALPGPVLTWSRTNTLFFQHVAGSDLELMSINSNGTALRQLTNNHVDDQSPAWSPDGRRIAFARNVATRSSPRFATFVMDASGRNAHRVTPASRRQQEGNPTWSPDGKRIAFFETGVGLVTIGTDGHRRRLIAPRAYGTKLDWSPNGRQFTFTALDPTAQTVDGLLGELVMVMSATGAKPHAITQGAQPAWSPDSKRIVFVHTDPCGRDCEQSTLHTISTEGTGERSISNSANVFDPRFSPDGRFIVGFGQNELVILDPARGVIRTFPLHCGNNGCTEPNWQPLLARPR
jgi:Tol biopolymer transport system component